LDEWGKFVSLKEILNQIRKDLQTPTIYKLAVRIKTADKPEIIQARLRELRNLIFSIPDKTLASEIWKRAKEKFQSTKEITQNSPANDTDLVLAKSVIIAKEKGWITEAEFELYKDIFPLVEKVSVSEEDLQKPEILWKGFFSAFQKTFEDSLLFKKWKEGELKTLPRNVKITKTKFKL